MTTPLRVLIIEDSEDDALLLLRLLRKGDYAPEYRRVETEAGLRSALKEEVWDVIISDYRLPDFDGLAALQLYQEANLDIPFILVSGTIGEELAVTAMRSGAHDYLMKENMTRLVPAVQRELQEAEVRRSHKQAEAALRESEEKYRTLFETAPEVIALVGLDGIVLDANEAVGAVAGLSRGEIIGKSFPALDVIPAEELQKYAGLFARLADGQNSPPLEVRIRHRNGNFRWLEVHFALLQREDKVWAILVIARDITERKQTEESLRRYAERLRILREIDLAIMAARSPEQIAQAALSHLRELVPYIAAGISMLDTQTLEAITFVTNIDERWGLLPGSRFPLAQLEGIEEVLDSLRRGDPWLIEDLVSLARIKPELGNLAAMGLRAVINVPLTLQDSLIGLISLGAGDPATFSEEQIEICREVAVQLAIGIQQAQLHEQVQRHAEELGRRVAERTADLQAANDRLEALGQVKDAFVSNVSHELRTPITSIKLYHYLLGARPEKGEEYMAALGRETERLESLIEGLLMLSRLDQDRQQVNPEPTNLNTLIATYVSDRGPLADSQGITITGEVAEPVPLIMSDPRLIGQVLSILLTNALAYTPPGGRVVVSTLRREQDGKAWVGFCVMDTGPGISAEEMEHLFQRFFRGAAGRKSQVPGTGLGLSIAKEIVDRHNGTIEVSSEGQPGKGACFTVWLPALQ